MSDRKNKEKEKVMSVRDRMGLFQTNNTTAPLRPNSGVSHGKAKEALKINTPLPSPAEPIMREYLNPHHFETFFKTLSSMKDEGFLLDITMSLGSDAYKIHYLVLAAVSPSVRRWFKSGGLDHTFSETVEPAAMFLDDKMTQLGIKAVVDFAYTGDVHVDVSDSIVEVLEACSWLEVDRLSQACSWILDPPQEEKTYQHSSSRERQKTFRAIQDLWEKGIGCDVRVQSDGQSFKAHRVALAAGGDFFRAMFSSGMKESLETTVHLPCLSSPVLSSLLRFIYSGAVLLSWGNVFEITEAALLYQVGGLLQLCLDFLQIEINEEYCLDCMALAEAYDLVELKDFVEQYILSNFEQVASVPKFQDLTEVQLVYFLDKDSLCVTSEVEVFKIVLLWVEEDITCRLEWVEDLMKRVRFPLMCPKELKEVQRAEIMRTNQGCKELLNRAIASLRPKPGAKPVTCKPRTPNQVLVLIGGDHLNNDFSRRLPSNRLWFAHKFFNGVGLIKHIDWRPLSTIPDIPRFRHAVAVLNNQLYIFGGSWYYGERDILKSVVRYHPSHDSWEHLPDMNESRNYFAVVCVDGAMYAMGGNVDNKRILDSVECYTPGDNTWRFVHPLHMALYSHATAVWDGEIYISGGYDSNNISLKSVSRYHPLQGCTPLSPMCNDRGGHVMEAIGSCLYVAGGLKQLCVGYSDQYLCESYDPLKDAWTPITNLPEAHVTPASTVLGGQIYILGGFCHKTYQDCQSIHRYEPQTDRWTNMGYMPQAYADMAACLLLVPTHLRQ
ncbi:kelch-like protein 33 isoform X1 [Acipenser oxyrinchus oxyrinchus]|uniref:Kelch-like protein 33 isoform X1 n=1 Tax=Acipenser oxyrinchus oxyrinchus TaxID=40147 RepID=A0AAD8CM08_ACIOX|nr:kelch-like protein 33 isoform X1 [Acipenser oxyrinchus oxyrinchus]